MNARIVGLMLALLMGSVVAHADTITITSGLVNLMVPSGDTTANLIGTGTDVFATGVNGPGSLVFNAGDIGSMQPNGYLSISSFAFPELIGGTLFPATDSVNAQLALRTFPFHTGEVSGPTATFFTPFALSGNLSVHDASGTILTNTALTGAGTASLTATVFPGVITQFATQNIAFQFNDSTPSPTPEPASLILLGTGLIGVMTRQRLRKRNGVGACLTR